MESKFVTRTIRRLKPHKINAEPPFNKANESSHKILLFVSHQNDMYT
ncbi:Uncharacterised protein [Vibrio harveyi]|nr:Uncharacterised protein [Vibrio harveyi]